MDKSKPARKSLTLQSVVVTCLVVAYQLIVPLFWSDRPEIPGSVFEALAGAGLLVAGYGRIRATERIGSGK